MKFLHIYFNFIISIFLFVGLLNGCNSDLEGKKAGHYQKGLMYAETGDFRSAVIEFQNAVQTDPMFANGRYQLGLAYLQTQQPGNALSELERAASLDPTNTDALIKVAEIYAIAGKPTESRVALEKIFQVNHDFSDAYALLAQIELMENNRIAAETAIHHALAVNPDNNQYNLIYARILTATGKVDQANAVLKKAVREDPSASNLKILIEFYTNQREYGEAEKTIIQLLEETPDAEKLHLDMASFYTSRGQRDKAEKHILAAIEENPQSPELRLHLGNFYLHSNMIDLAEQTFMDAIENAAEPVDEKAILADFYFHIRRYKQAEALATSVLENNNGHPHARLVKAKLLVRQQKNSEALAILDPLASEFPRSGEVYYQKGLAHLNRGETRLSYSAADMALQYMPNNPDAKTLMAHHLMLQQDFNESKRKALSVLEIMPGNFRAGIIYAQSILHLGEIETAVELFERMSIHEPDNIELLYNKATAYQAHGRSNEAIATFKEILAINPDFIPAMSAVTALMVERKETDRSIAVLREQLRKTPNNPHYLIMLAELVNKWKKSPDEALELLKQARKTAPDIPELYILTADILTQQGKIDKAIESYRIAIQKSPNDIKGYMALGSLLEQAGDFTNARNAYSNALRIQPNFAIAANNLAWLITKDENPDLAEALRLALIAKKAYPDNPYIADTLGYVHYKRGAYQLAITQFTQALQKRPDMPMFRYHLAKTLYAGNHLVEAKSELEKVLKIETDFSEYKEAENLLSEIENKL